MRGLNLILINLDNFIFIVKFFLLKLVINLNLLEKFGFFVIVFVDLFVVVSGVVLYFLVYIVWMFFEEVEDLVRNIFFCLF